MGIHQFSHFFSSELTLSIYCTLDDVEVDEGMEGK